MTSAKRMLFILDLDRVLLHRVKTKLDKLQAEKHPYYTKPRYTVKGDHINPRPGTYNFLKSLFDLGDVAVWTTSMSGYTGPLVMYSFHGLHNISDTRSRIQMIDMTVRTNKLVRKEAIKRSGPYSLQFVWGLNMCDVISPVLENHSTTESPPPLTDSPEESHSSTRRLGELVKKDKTAVMYAKGDLKPQFIKNLDRVWQKFPQYTPENTLMIGADPKTQQIDRYPLNNIVVPPFDVLDRYVNFTEDSCLPTLAAFLESQLAPPPSSTPAPSVGEAVEGQVGEEGKDEQPTTIAEAVQHFDLERLSKAYQELIAQTPDPNQ